MPNRTLHLLHKTNPNHYLFDYHTCISKIQKGTILLQGQQIFQIEIEGHFFQLVGPVKVDHLQTEPNWSIPFNF